jgi:hypothetical protein
VNDGGHERQPTWENRAQQVAAGELEITFWTELETGDDLGWDG